MSLANRTIDLASKQVLVAADGTAAAPSITNDGDTNTGMFFPAADTIAFSEGGTEAMRIDSSGRVGIGTDQMTSSGADLHIFRASGATVRLDRTGAGTCTIQSAETGVSLRDLTLDANTLLLNTASTERLRIDSSGNVLVNTTANDTGAKLEVKQAASGTGFGVQAQGNDNPKIQLRLASGSTGVGGEITSNGGLVLSTSNTERLRIDSSGRVGIGTTSPATAYRMSLTGDGSTMVGGLSLTSAGITYIGAPSANSSAFEIWNAADNYVRIGTNNTERLRITSGGKVQIGTTTDYGNVTRVEVNFTGAGTEYGIGLNAESLSIQTQWAQFTSGSGTDRGSIDWSGSAVRYNTSSDYRLKENITEITNGIDRVKNLKPSRFNLKEYPTQTIDGFIAHEVEEVVPEAVSGEKDAVDSNGNPKYQGIDQSKLVPLLTAALKEAIAEIEILKSKVAALEAA